MQDMFLGRHCIIDQDVCVSHASARFHLASMIPSSAKTNEEIHIGAISGMMQRRLAIFASAAPICIDDWHRDVDG